MVRTDLKRILAFLNGEGIQRRLAAVLAADVAGYGRLMGADEEGTLAQLKAIKKAVVDPTIAAHRNRIVNARGGRVLVEFASAVDAVRSAVEIQRGVVEQNAAQPRDRRIEFRIGIHVGDIMFDENDIFGDGVNIASRLEAMAEPGGICISEGALREIRGKVDIDCDDLGPQILKNITEPVRAWRLVARKRLESQAAAARLIGRERDLAAIAAALTGVPVRACSKSISPGKRKPARRATTRNLAPHGCALRHLVRRTAPNGGRRAPDTMIAAPR